MKKALVLLGLFFLLIGVSTVFAAPTQYVQFFESVHQFGTIDGQTTDLVPFKVDGSQFVLETRLDSANEIYLVEAYTGIFSPEGAYGSASSQTVEAAVADFDGDGELDFVACNAAASNSIWYGDGTGHFSGGYSLGNATDSCSGVTAGQLDGSYGEDLVIANTNGQLQVWLSQSDGSLSLSNSFGVVGYNDVQAVKVNTDGYIDVFAVSDNTVDQVWLGDGAGNFTLDSTQVTAQIGGKRIAIGDVDNDQDSDIFVAGPNSHGYNNQAGFLSGYVSPNFSYAAADVLVADLDGEVGDDVYFISENGSWLYTGATLTWWSTQLVSTGVTVGAVDADSDTDLDVLVGRTGYNSIFKGGPLRTTVTFDYTSLSFNAELGGMGSEFVGFDFGGNSVRYERLQLPSWIVVDPSYLQFIAPPSFLGMSFFMDADGGMVAAAGTYNDVVRIYTNDPENEVIEVPATFVVSAANMVVTPLEINDTQPEDAGVVGHAVTIQNTGDVAMYCRLETTASWINVDTDWVYVPAGETVSAAVNLIPAAATIGSNTGTVQVVPSKDYLETLDIAVTLNVTEAETMFVYLPFITR